MELFTFANLTEVINDFVCEANGLSPADLPRRAVASERKNWSFRKQSPGGVL